MTAKIVQKTDLGYTSYLAVENSQEILAIFRISRVLGSFATDVILCSYKCVFSNSRISA